MTDRICSYRCLSYSITVWNNVQQHCFIRLHSPHTTFFSTIYHAAELRSLILSARNTKASQSFLSSSMTACKDFAFNITPSIHQQIFYLMTIEEVMCNNVYETTNLLKCHFYLYLFGTLEDIFTS